MQFLDSSRSDSHEELQKQASQTGQEAWKEVSVKHLKEVRLLMLQNQQLDGEGVNVVRYLDVRAEPDLLAALENESKKSCVCWNHLVEIIGETRL